MCNKSVFAPEKCNISLLEAHYFDYACLEWHHCDADHVPYGIHLEHGEAAHDMLIMQRGRSGMN